MDLLIYLIITLTSVFIGLFLGKNLVKLKFKSKHAALKERNNFLNQPLQKKDIIMFGWKTKENQSEIESTIFTPVINKEILDKKLLRLFSLRIS